MRKILTLCAALLVLCAAPAWAGNSTPTLDPVQGATWVLDTTGIITTATVRIRVVYWTGCTTDGHTFVINDAAGNLIWPDYAGEANKGHVFYLDRIAVGITLQTLGSGALTLDVQPVRY